MAGKIMGLDDHAEMHHFFGLPLAAAGPFVAWDSVVVASGAAV